MAIQYTANFNLPYPNTDRSDTPDVPRDFAALAAATDAALLAVRRDDLIGEIKLWPNAASPTGFILCDGSLLDQAGTYARLYAVIGVAFNTGGEAAGKFRLPDGRGRVMLGIDPVGVHLTVSTPVLGDTFGEERHTLSIAELASHDHVLDPLGTAGRLAPLADSWDTAQGVAGGATFLAPKVISGGAGPSSTGRVHTNGSGNPHNNMQPCVAFGNYIIRYV